jgi:hypothetical protein
MSINTHRSSNYFCSVCGQATARSRWHDGHDRPASTGNAGEPTSTSRNGARPPTSSRKLRRRGSRRLTLGQCTSNSDLGTHDGRSTLFCVYSSFPLPTNLLFLQIFGPNWRCPSPTILHIGNPDNPTSNFSSICPVWKKSNELFGKVFTYHHRSPGATSSSSSSNNSLVRSDTAEAGLLYLGIKQGWDNLPSLEWMKSPALTILKQVDELLFKHLPDVERLAVAYKSFKLLRVR